MGTPENFTSNEDGEYAFYRNTKEDDVYLDDAFCIQYNMTQDDTTCAKHMDPSDITINMCLEKSNDVIGSEVVFYGTQKLVNNNVINNDQSNLQNKNNKTTTTQNEDYCCDNNHDNQYEFMLIKKKVIVQY